MHISQNLYTDNAYLRNSCNHQTNPKPISSQQNSIFTQNIAQSSYPKSSHLNSKSPKSLSIASQLCINLNQYHLVSSQNHLITGPTHLKPATCYANYMIHVMPCNAMQKKPKTMPMRDQVSSPGLMVSEPTALIPNCHEIGRAHV